MKKIISVIAAVSMLFALSTSAFAYKATDAVTSGATLADNTITYDPASTAGFTFEIAATDNFAMMTYVVDWNDAASKGWTFEIVETASPTNETNASNKIQVKYGNGTWDVKDQVVLGVKAVPGAGATIAGASFKLTISGLCGGKPYSANVTYTIAEGASEDKTTATIGANGEVTFDYADADAADAKLAGKKVVLGTAYAGNLITADTTVKVTYTPVEGAAETKTFGETLFEKLTTEGEGTLATKTITFGIVCDTAMTGTFSFALN